MSSSDIGRLTAAVATMLLAAASLFLHDAYLMGYCAVMALLFIGLRPTGGKS